MTFLKVIFFLLITWTTALTAIGHYHRLQYSEASRMITDVLGEGPELRESCRQLIVSDALILKSGKRAEKAKRTCEEVFGI